MPIVDLQRRARELGRIRIGQVVPGRNGGVRPEKLDKFRLTSSSKALLDKVAGLYGGTVREWTPQGGGAIGWEVVTDSARLPVLVPPQPVSQYYELWSGAGCVRRCDGATELLSDSPCVCSPDDRECKPTTRLNVILRDVEGIGVWRLESKGYSAAAELPDVADFLAQSRGYITGYLCLEERVSKKDGKTKRFMVPTIEVDVTPSQLMAGNGAQEISGPAPRELSVPDQRALPAAPIPEPTLDVDGVRAALTTIAAGGTLQDLRDIWKQILAAGLESEGLKAAEEMRQAVKPAQPAEESPDELNALWLQILQTVPEDWTSTRTENEFRQHTGVLAEDAGAGEMRAYLEHLAAS